MRKLIAVVAVAAAAGCSPEHTLSGRVRVTNGSPVPHGQVVVESTEGKTGAAGNLREDGSFAVTGLAAGEYAVYLSDPVVPVVSGGPPPAPDAPSGPLVDARYTKPKTSGWRVAVPSPGPVEFVADPPTR